MHAKINLLLMNAQIKIVMVRKHNVQEINTQTEQGWHCAKLDK